MVLDLRVPPTDAWQAIQPAIPLLVAYALAYINIGIFWTNHHHMLATASRVNGRALWANLFLLFWLTLMPFVIRWIGLAGVTPQPVAAYGAVTVTAAFGYILLERELGPGGRHGVADPGPAGITQKGMGQFLSLRPRHSGGLHLAIDRQCAFAALHRSEDGQISGTMVDGRV
jgi:hypothetical protein